MSMVAGSIKEIVSIKIKARHDSISDQYNRIFMVKMCIISSAIIGVNYFNDKVSCIVANSNGMDGGFVGSACWIQGFYIFKEMKDRLSESGYYGIPKNMDYDGINPLGQLCTTVDRGAESVYGCKPMEKLYYLQYQYMPFFTASLAIFFYLPYIIFKTVNTDLISLKDVLKKDETTVDDLIKSFFNSRINNRRRLRYRVAMNIIVKILYLLANIAAFVACDSLLNGDFSSYGLNYSRWAQLDNGEAHAHNLKVRSEAKPGNVLLPPMGFCDIHEASRDVRNTFINRHKFICEISPHVLYQYVMVVLWFLLVVGIVVSICGLLSALFGHLVTVVCFMGAQEPARNMYRVLTLREIDYLEYIRRKDMPKYGEILTKLRDERQQGIEMKQKNTKF